MGDTITKARGPEITYGYFGNIVKFDKLDDGTLMVYGKAVGPEIDLDEQICDPVWLKTAMPDWFEWGNVREQHNNIASGVGVEMTEGEDGGYWLRTHVVDPGTIKKVETRVLKGYSVGISNGRVVRDKAARGGRINDGKIHEISLVDRPANAACSISIAKSIDGVKFSPVEVGEFDEDGAEVVAVIDMPELDGLQIIDTPATDRMHDDMVDAMTLAKTAAWYREAIRRVEDALAGEWSHTVPFITKAAKASSDDEHADVTAAYAAMDQILDLIITEATQAKGGRIKELRDIEVLLSACRSLCHFIECETDEDDAGLNDGDLYDEDDDDKAYMIKAFGSAAGQPAADPATVIVDNAEITKAVAAAVAESARAHEAEIATLRDQLEKAQAQPLTGGPVTFKHVKSTSSAPVQALTEADPAYWIAQANNPELGVDVQRAYLAKAASLTKGAST